MAEEATAPEAQVSVGSVHVPVALVNDTVLPTGAVTTNPDQFGLTVTGMLASAPAAWIPTDASATRSTRTGARILPLVTTSPRVSGRSVRPIRVRLARPAKRPVARR